MLNILCLRNNNTKIGEILLSKMQARPCKRFFWISTQPIFGKSNYEKFKGRLPRPNSFKKIFKMFVNLLKFSWILFWSGRRPQGLSEKSKIDTQIQEDELLAKQLQKEEETYHDGTSTNLPVSPLNLTASYRESWIRSLPTTSHDATTQPSSTEKVLHKNRHRLKFY